MKFPSFSLRSKCFPFRIDEEKKESRRRRKSARLRIETLIDVGTENKSRMQTAPEKKLRRPDICLLIKSVLCEKRHVTQIV